MSVIWRKVWRDLAHNKLRTLLAVLSTAVGVFALGLVFGMSGVMHTRMTEDHQATIPAHITFWGGPFDQAIVDAVLREAGLADAEGELLASFRWKLEGETYWRDGNLVARADCDAQRMNLIDLVDGHWPAGRALAVERQSSWYFDILPDTTIIVEFGKRGRRLPIEGIVRVPTVYPPQLGGDVTFYATPETVTWLTDHENFDQLHIRLESFSEETADEAAERIERRLERMGFYVGGHRVADPDVHPMQERVDTFFLILGILGGLSLGLSAFLIINTMSALMAQQIWQIGVMKVLGATFWRVVCLYLTVALTYGGLAFCLAVPLSICAIYPMAEWFLDMMNISIGAYRMNMSAISLQAAVSLGVPVLAALMSVVSGARITVHEALDTYGLGGKFGQSPLDRWIGHLRCLPRLLVLGLRNNFRRKARIVLTLIALVFSGALFIMVMSAGNSLSHSMEMLMSDVGMDVDISFEQPYRAALLESAIANVPGVTHVEVWGFQNAVLVLDSAEEQQVQVWGVPPDTQIFSPRVVGGRRLLPGDGHAILLNQKVATDEDISVGEKVTLTIGGQQSAWRVVGLIFNINNRQRDHFVPFDALAQESGYPNHGTMVRVVSENQNFEDQEVLGDSLCARYAERHLKVEDSVTSSAVREQTRSQNLVITSLLMAMSVLAATVGGLGLTSTMSINVVERGREIGVMRSIGATSFAIAEIFVIEGVFLGILSWLLALPLSYPGALVFSWLIGMVLLGGKLDFSYSVVGAALWLVITVVLSALASLWPALRATKVSVREALAYE